MPEKKQRNKRSVAITIAVFIFILVGAGIFSIYQITNSPGRSDTVSVRIPVIRTPMTSASNGREYTVQTQFYVQMDRDTRRAVSNTTLEEALSEIMKDMEYDAVASLNGIDYINNRATEQLNEYLSDFTQTRVVVTGLATDDRIQLEDDPHQMRDDAMRGIFQNMD